MKCPFCGYNESKVIDSRPAEEGATIRRRRECLACNRRFTTYEIIERMPLVVVKRDGSRQSFDKVKLINGMVRACEKRPVSLAQLEAVADDIEQELQSNLEREIKTVAIGEMVMVRLKELDEVAYVRFASVYRSFKDINTFMEELSKLLTEGDSKNTANCWLFHFSETLEMCSEHVKAGEAGGGILLSQMLLQFIEGIRGFADNVLREKAACIRIGGLP